ncbi:MAG: hypothetical protein EON54_02650 [Alcaligenaceae bacterium]|uniref:hypothetical protein n=1 Tax=Curvibacter soli TaxID=3031331 RepID=UPI0010EF03CB|nr:hypothetical protein [Ramlibacter sp. H39-3-26]MDF1484176.1 hypothetical protein [Ramlibacter sp. H39-3-26]RYH69201.1 MAG: hypothetical protein EON54_02650 [Alcaligenaceae bacterium]
MYGNDKAKHNGSTGANLKARFPYMFQGPNIGLDLYEGWMQILARACKRVDVVLGQHKAEFHFCQIKEKYGSARFYYSDSGMTEDRRRDVDAVLDNAETETETACMLCGKPARIDLHGAWWACLCEFHATERRMRVGKQEASVDATL